MLHLLVSLKNAAARLRDEETGATAVEYGLMVSLIAVVIAVTVGLLGDQLNSTFDSVLTTLGG